MTDCLFCKIAAKQIPSSIVYEDDKVLAFNDIAPQAPVHILIIPKAHVASLADVKDHSILSDLFLVVNKLAREKGLDKTGFRTVINNGRAAGQAINHLHIHLLGGRDFSWPPGFTIIEMIITVVVMAILAIFSTVVINNAVRDLQLNNAADKVASDLRYASSMATGTAVWYGVSFEANPINKYTIYTTTGTVDTIVAYPGKLGSSFIVNLENDYGVKISGVNIAGGGKVEFSPLGVPYNDKTGSAIATEGVITLIKGSSSKTVRITPNTGRIYTQ